MTLKGFSEAMTARLDGRVKGMHPHRGVSGPTGELPILGPARFDFRTAEPSLAMNRMLKE
jgi:hypothetical protein